MKRKQVIQRMVINDQKRMFDAALSDRLSMSWDSNSYTIDQIIFQQLDVLRSRARQQARNNDYVVRLIQTLKNNIVGASGFKLRAKMSTKQGKANHALRKNIEMAWADFEQQVELVDIENLIMSAMVTDGEAFVFMRVDSRGNLWPELIDPIRIDTQFNDQLSSGNNVVMGIEYDNHLKPVAYHVNDSYERAHPGMGQAVYSGKRTRVEAQHILHIFIKMFVSQKRGIPWISASMGRLFQLNKAEDAAVVAMRIGAAKMGFFYNEDDEEYSGDEETDEMTMNAEAGTFQNIGKMKFQPFDPQFPNGEVAPFIERILKGVSAGWGVDYHTIANDLSAVNYSSARVGMLETREMYKGLQTWLIRQFVKPLYIRWLSLIRLAGQIGKLPNDATCCCVQFVGRRWEWVDPQKEANGKQTLYQMKVISLSQIIRERGDEPEDVFQEIAEENKLMRELGITAEQVLEKVSPTANQQEEKEDAAESQSE